ncbi:MAG: class I SAM-dependent methyltransferase [Bauldia sp.]|nr:class I SAM-dependent methyltransferase [Bauldia sp.]
MGETGNMDAPGSGSLATINDDHVVAAYARWAPIYDWSFGAFTRRPCREAVAEMNTLPPGRIIELGVGTGISLPLYDRKHRITGVDLSREMLARARKRVAEDGLSHVEALEVMDAGALSFEDGAFDAAMAMFVITVVPDPGKVMAEMARVVRPGGTVILVSHFSVETGPRAVVERYMARFSSRLGWRPNFPIETVLGRPELRLVERRPVKSFDLFTLLRFERV